MAFPWLARLTPRQPQSVQSGSAQSRKRTAKPRVEELEPRVVLATDLFTVGGATGEQAAIGFNWAVRDAAFNNEIGVYVVSDDAGTFNGLAPTDAGYAQAVLQGGQTVFRSGEGAGARRELTFTAGDRLAFYLVQNATAQAATSRNSGNTLGGGPVTFFSVDGASPDNFDHVETRALGDRSTLFTWEDLTNGGDQDFNDVEFSVGPAGDRAALTPGQAGQTVEATFARLRRETVFRNELGLFITDNAAGAVGGVNPGDAGYLTAALNSPTRQRIFEGGPDAASTATVTLPAGAFYGLYLVANGTAEEALANNPSNQPGNGPFVYFSFFAANPDGFDHLRWDTETDFAWEDLFGGGDRDFDDIAARVFYGDPQGTPTDTDDTTAPAQPTLDLAAASDTGTPGDQRTDNASVTLTGTTEAGAAVLLVQTGATTTADATGNFSFTDVALALGSNTFTVRATDAAGNSSETTRSFVRQTAPFVRTAIAAVPLATNSSTTLDLAGNFDDADIANTRIRFETSAGPINVELLDRQAPRTVANFLNYVTDGDYTNSIFHRSADLANGTPFVLQGGGFTFLASPSRLQSIPTDPAVQNEPDTVNRSNLRGTLAMAKLGNDPNSATDQFFFNLGNNSANLDNQNGGFTVFGRVVGAADQAVVDTLAAIPTQNQGAAPALPLAQQGVFTEIPLQNYTGLNFPTDTAAANYALISALNVVQRTEELTYSVTNNTNPAVVSTNVVDNRLTLTAGAQTGTATITVRATDRGGSFVESTFTVTVS